MDINEKVELIKLLSDLNGMIIVHKLEGKDTQENFERAKKVAKKLSDEGIGNFDFSSDESFKESLNDFLTEF